MTSWVGDSAFRKSAKLHALLGLDVAAATIALAIALVFCLSFAELSALKKFGIVVAAATTGASAGIFYFAGLSQRFWRFVSIVDLAVILVATAVNSAFAFVVLQLAIQDGGAPAALFPLHWLLSATAMGGMRITRRFAPALRSIFRKLRRSDLQNLPTALVAGNPECVDIVLRQIESGLTGGYRPIGILDESDDHIRRSLRGVPILGGVAEINRVIASLKAKNRAPDFVIIAASDDAASDPKYVSLASAAFGLDVKVLRALIGGPVSQKRLNLKDFDLQELLGRPAMKFDLDLIARAIRGRRVVVTGAGGSIGSELSRQIVSFEPASIVLLEAGEFNLYKIEMELRESFPHAKIIPLLCDICNRNAVMRAFEVHKPELVFHAAALKHVPLVEQNPCAGAATNILGTRNIADAATRLGAIAMVQVSTDKAVNPIGVMGATKRVGELYCQLLDLEGANTPGATRFMTVRFGNVLGSSGSVIPLFRRQLRAGLPLTVTHPDMTRYFMTTHEAVSLILQSTQSALENDVRRGRIFVLDMGEPVKVLDIANRMIRLAGLQPGVTAKIEFVGTRPGEKLFEELFDTAETRLKSHIPGVFEAEPAPLKAPVLAAALEAISKSVVDGDELAVKREIFALIARPAEEVGAEPAFVEMATTVETGRSPSRETVELRNVGGGESMNSLGIFEGVRRTLKGEIFKGASPLNGAAKPVFEAPLKITSRWPVYAEDEISAVSRVLASGRVNSQHHGDNCRAFEKIYADFCQMPYAIALANGTLGLELALRALGVGPGHEVVVTSRSFIASASCVVNCGATPIFADVDLESQNLTSETVRAVLTERTRAIIAVHLAGLPCEMDDLCALAAESGLKLIEDCAQAHGATYKGKPIGSFGDASVFSFCTDKIISTGGEGGMLLLKDEAAWKRAWSYKDHGKDYDAFTQKASGMSFRWLHNTIGTNFRLTEMQAAIGIKQMEKLETWLSERRRRAAILDDTLSGLKALRLPPRKNHLGHANYKYYAFVVPERLKPRWDRDRILREVAAQGAPIQSGSCPEIYLEGAFANSGVNDTRRLPNAKRLGETSILSPIDPTLTVSEVQQIGDILRRTIESATA